MSHKIFRPFIVKVSVLGYFPLIADIEQLESIINCVIKSTLFRTDLALS